MLNIIALSFPEWVGIVLFFWITAGCLCDFLKPAKKVKKYRYGRPT